ncbi:hypothetical protein OJAV_G00044280, partial [Oryzias javanicus]
IISCFETRGSASARVGSTSNKTRRPRALQEALQTLRCNDPIRRNKRRGFAAGAWLYLPTNDLLAVSKKHNGDGLRSCCCLEDLIMDQRWVKILLTLVFYLQVTPGAERTIQEGSSTDFRCQIKEGTMIFWFRVTDHSNMEFIASFSNTGMEKKFEGKNIFKHEKNGDDFVLTQKSFSAQRDSGAYICAALVKGNTLQFGEVTRVSGEKKEKTTKATTTTKAPAVISTRSPSISTSSSCNCAHIPTAEKTKPFLPCDPIILGPLAGGCGLLLLLLLIITLYCNRLRTRRCPHHYKRKPRVFAPEKQMMTNVRI